MESKNRENFWVNVTAHRRLLGMSLKTLASTIDVSYETLKSAKKNNFLPQCADRIADVLQVTLDELTASIIDLPNNPMKHKIHIKISNYRKPVSDNHRKQSSVFWHNAKERREDLELTQAYMAEKLGFTTSNYSAKERGLSPMLPKSLAESVAKLLDTTVDELMKPQEEPIVNPQVQPIAPSDYDISHLPIQVQKFLADESNYNVVIDMVLNHVLTSRKPNADLKEYTTEILEKSLVQ